MVWIPKRGQEFVIDSIAPHDTAPCNKAGERHTCLDSGTIVPDNTGPSAQFVYLATSYATFNGGRLEPLGTYCVIRPADPELEAMWRLGCL